MSWRRRGRLREALTGYAFVLPALLLFGVWGVYTVGYGLLLSLARWNGFSPQWIWVGLDNYADLLYRDPTWAPEVRDAAAHTAAVMIAVPLLTVAAPLEAAT